MSFTLKDAPQDVLDGIERDRERSQREEAPILAKLSDLDAAMDEIGRPSQEESIALLVKEAKRLGILDTDDDGDPEDGPVL